MNQWRVVIPDGDVLTEFKGLPRDIQARFVRIFELMEKHGLSYLTMPYVRHVEGKIWEARAKGKDGIARGLYFTATGQTVCLLRFFMKKTQKTPKREIELAKKRMEGMEK